MKAGIVVLAVGVLQATEPEPAIWYDSKGKVALIEAVPAAPPREPFVPQWVAREERRDRALKGEFRHRRSRTWSSWGWGYPSFRVRYRTPVHHHHRCSPAGGIRVIIR